MARERDKRRRRGIRWPAWAIPLPALLLCGCTAFVARQITHPGHHVPDRQLQQYLLGEGLQRRELRTNGGVRIAYWLVPPRAYGVIEKVERHERDGHLVGFNLGFRFGANDPAQLPLLPAQGSVLLLHPWGMSGLAMVPWALAYAQAGYVAVAPDLRSQGGSGDAPVGYGPREAVDVQDFVRQLRGAGALPDPLYVVGASYGATVALFAAPGLPRVRGVLAMEPYADAAGTIRRAPASGLFGHRWLARWVGPRTIDAAIARASHQLGVDLTGLDASGALAASPACTLIVRGAGDRLIPAEALRAMSARSLRATYVEVAGESHLSLPVSTDRLLEPSLAWMQALSVGNADACPEFSPLPAPAHDRATASPAAGSSVSAPAPTTTPAPAARAPATAGR